MDHDSNTYKTLTLAAPGAYVEDIDWQGLRNRFVSNIGSQAAYGQQAASQYLSTYFSLVDPRNPGTGCSLDGQKVNCQSLYRGLNNGSVGKIVLSTTGGLGGGNADNGVIVGAFSLAQGQIAAELRSALKRRDGLHQTLRMGGDIVGEWDTPPSLEITGEFFFGGGQQGGGRQGDAGAPSRKMIFSPCAGKTPADLDYDRVRTYNDGNTESGRDHIFRNHTFPGVTSPPRLLLQAVLFKKSLYGLNKSVSQSDFFDSIKQANADTFSFGTRRTQTDAQGNVTQIVFTYEFKPTVLPDGKLRLNFTGVQYKGRNSSISNSNTLILDPDCVGVQTSFPGTLN